MRTYVISSKNQKTLFEGQFNSFNECLEHAVNNNVDLSHADLKHKNLTNINLDDARLTYADLTGANLTGANLSEARLLGANFTNAALHSCCLAYSDLQHCLFNQTAFGATDITGANISFSHFAGQSAYSLSFTDVGAMKNCLFTNTCGAAIETSQSPIVISGLKTTPIVLFNNQLSKDIRQAIT